MNGPTVTVNGPTEQNGSESEPVWERLWSLEEIRRTSGSWSLAADAGLLLFLQDFSQRMLSKTHEIEKQLDGLIRETKTTDCRLHNVFNDFLMLSNTQFIENRVYDEELEEPVLKSETGEKPEQEKTREQKEAELIPKVQEAVNYGLRVLEFAFEQLDIKAGNSDSEEEEVNERVELILEPKDLYIDRPLPYLIGSQQFMEQDDVGLGDLSSDEDSIDSDRGSIIDSEEDHDEVSEDESEYEKEDEEKTKRTHTSEDEYDKDDDGEDDGSDLFGDSEEEEDDKEEEDMRTRKRGPASTFADELAARIKGDPPNKLDEERTSLSSGEATAKKKRKGKKETKVQLEDNSDDLFKPSEQENEDFSVFSGTGGLFSGGKGLFDDEEEGDLFADAPKEEPQKEIEAKARVNKEPQMTRSGKKLPTGAVSIFPGDQLFNPTSQLADTEEKTAKKPTEEKNPTAIKQITKGGLFDDDDGEEDNFFIGSSIKKSNSVPGKTKSKSASDLFVDNDDGYDLFKEKTDIAPSAAEHKEGPVTEKKPSVNVSESAPKPSEKSQHSGLFSDEEDSQDLFSSNQSTNRNQSKPSALPQSKSATFSLFDDDDEDNLFGSAPAKIPTVTAVKKHQETVKPTQHPKRPKPGSLFSSDEEDQWESSRKSRTVPKADTKDDLTKVTSTSPHDSKLDKKTSPSLFDADEDDLFVVTKKDSHMKPKKAALLFEDDENEGGSLFDSKTVTSKSVPEITPKPAPKPQVPSLFDEDEKEGLFEKPTEKKSTGQKPEIKKKPAGAVSLFGGIDVLKEQKNETAGYNSSITPEPEDENPFKAPPPPLEKETKSQNLPSLFDEKEEEEEEEQSTVSKVKTPVHQDIFKAGYNNNIAPEPEDDNPFKATPPPLEKETKSQNLPSLFDEEEEEEEEEEEQNIVSKVKTPVHQDIFKSSEERTRTKSTGVFQDEELLFSQKQQKDNDPEVDLFAATRKPSSGKPGFSKAPTGPNLFGGEDEEEDLFAVVKPKQPPAALAINPSSLLPGSAPRIPGAVAVMPGMGSFSSQTDDAQSNGIKSSTTEEAGVSFDTPAQADTLHSANKSRAKVTGKRRPPTRTTRHVPAQLSGETEEVSHMETPYSLQAGSITEQLQPQPTESLIAPGQKESSEDLSIAQDAVTLDKPLVSENKDAVFSTKPKIADNSDGLFHSDDLFATSVPQKQISDSKPKENDFKEVVSKPAQRESSYSVFSDQGGGDLFQSAKQKTKKLKQASFLEDEDEEDLFGTGKTTVVKRDSRPAVQKESKLQARDIFEDDIFATEVTKSAKKTQEKSLDSSLFDDDVDIFADVTVKPKEKKTKKKVETKSIFGDDMDDIFSSSSKTKTTKPKSKSTKKAPDAAADSKVSNIFDDPLNAFGSS